MTTSYLIGFDKRHVEWRFVKISSEMFHAYEKVDDIFGNTYFIYRLPVTLTEIGDYV